VQYAFLIHDKRVEAAFFVCFYRSIQKGDPISDAALNNQGAADQVKKHMTH
jgi:hypothetical protein